MTAGQLHADHGPRSDEQRERDHVDPGAYAPRPVAPLAHPRACGRAGVEAFEGEVGEVWVAVGQRALDDSIGHECSTNNMKPRLGAARGPAAQALAA